MKTRRWIRLLVLIQVLAFAMCVTAFTDHAVAQGRPHAEFVGGREYRQVNGKWYHYINGEQGSQILPCRLIVKLKSRGKITPSTFSPMGLNNVSISSRRFLDGYYIVDVSKGRNPFEAARGLVNSRLYDVVEFDALGVRQATPDDSRFDRQWNLQAGKLDMERAWDIETGDSTVVIAIIDNGVDYEHDDLLANIWVNPGEDLDGDGFVFDWGDTNGVDDDGNGYVDDLIGWDYFGDNPDPPGQDVCGAPRDTTYEDNDPNEEDVGYWHGTNCAGVASAVTNNNGVGISGVAGGWGTTAGPKLMVLRDGTWFTPVSWTSMAIEYAADMGADVISISTCWRDSLTCLESACDYATEEHDAVVVAAAGYASESMHLGWPARYATTIAAGVSNRQDEPTGDVAWGATPDFELDVLAPADSIFTTDVTGEPGNTTADYWINFRGNSAATPEVAGIAALIRSADPTLSWTRVRDILRHTAVDTMAGMNEQDYTDTYGYGRVEAFRAVIAAKYNAEVVSGNITANTTWPTEPTYFDNVYVLGDVSVNSGYTLTISPGTTVYCAADSAIEFEVEGTLLADASSDSAITFQSADDSPAAGDWDGIETFASSGSVVLKNCVIKDANIGVKLRYADGTASSLENCSFENMELEHIDIFGDVDVDVKDCTFNNVDSPYCIVIGTDTSSVTTVIENCHITGTSDASYGIWVSSGGATLKNNRIEGFTTGSGIKTTGSSWAVVNGDTLRNCKYGVRCEATSEPTLLKQPNETYIVNCTSGLYTEDTSSPDLADVSIDSCTVGLETRDSSEPTVVDDNAVGFCTKGLYARDTSEPYIRNTVFDNCTTYGAQVTFAADPNLGTNGDAGNNSFYPSDSCPTYRQVMGTKQRAAGLDSVKAVLNWWGSSNPSSSCFVGWVDHTPWLNSDPSDLRPGQEPGRETLTFRPALLQNYPNPFGRTTLISYQVPNPGAHVTLRVYDAMGRLVKTLIDENQQPGLWEVAWNGGNDDGRIQPSGIYFYEIEIGDDFRASKKMSLVR